jgi:imidazolonepropionase-like amidohydrolase
MMPEPTLIPHPFASGLILMNFTQVSCSQLRSTVAFGALVLLNAFIGHDATAAEANESSVVVIKNARVFDGKSDKLQPDQTVIVVGNKIDKIGKALNTPSGAKVIDAGNRVLTPGLIDAHVHLSMVLPPPKLLTTDPQYAYALMQKGAERMLMRGFTSVRDMAGPVFGLKQAIDEGLTLGPRVYPSGAAISQTAGHGDFRQPTDLNKNFGGTTYATELRGLSFLADGKPQVLAAVRENLRLGATQIKVMAGGGVTSLYDPLDVNQFTAEELKAAVDAADDWGTYVSTHIYNPVGMRRALEAGVKAIEHGHLIDEPTMKFLAEKNAFLSTQVYTFTQIQPGLNEAQIKRKQLAREGTDVMMRLARMYKVKVVFGSDLISDLKYQDQQNREFAERLRWFTPAEVLKQATSVAAELLALCGKRNPYPGKLGVVEEGAYADLLLVDGNPLEDLKLLEDPDKNLVLIMKDGRIVKNVLKN